MEPELAPTPDRGVDQGVERAEGRFEVREQDGGGRRGMMGIVVHHVEVVRTAGDADGVGGVLASPRLKLGVIVGRVEVPVAAMGRHLVEPLRGRDQPNGEDFEPVAVRDLNGINEGRVVDDHGSFGLLRSVVGG